MSSATRFSSTLGRHRTVGPLPCPTASSCFAVGQAVASGTDLHHSHQARHHRAPVLECRASSLLPCQHPQTVPHPRLCLHGPFFPPSLPGPGVRPLVAALRWPPGRRVGAPPPAPAAGRGGPCSHKPGGALPQASPPGAYDPCLCPRHRHPRHLLARKSRVHLHPRAPHLRPSPSCARHLRRQEESSRCFLVFGVFVDCNILALVADYDARAHPRALTAAVTHARHAT